MWRVLDCQHNDWWPVVLLAVFNVCDLGIRCLPKHMYAVSGKTVLALTLARMLLFLPLFVYTDSASYPNVFNDAASIALVALFAATNGFLATVTMQEAPKKVASHDRDAAGMFMTFFLQFGSVMGATAALLIDRVHVTNY